MQKTSGNGVETIRFKHFSRKGYALFACLGKVVLVGTLSVSTLTHARAEGISIRTEEAADSLHRTELKLDEVVITGSRAPLTLLESAKIVSVITRDDVQRAAAESINDILKLVPGVDVRQRGGYGVQTDISVRGGNFDQITILLNGVPIASPQTGHLSADFPVSPDDIERIEVLEGSAARVYGTAAFNGAINIVTTRTNSQKEDSPLSAYVNLAGGSYGYANGNAGVGLDQRIGDNSLLHHQVSGGYSRSDGPTENSAFTSSRFFYTGSYESEDIKVNAQAGYSYKPYGANTFYGAASTSQWESNERIMAAVNADVTLGKLHVLPQLYWNRWYDHYQWKKDNPAGENFHSTDSYGGELNAWFESALGKTSFGVELRREAIWSTKLGELVGEDSWKKSGGHDAQDDVFYKYHDARNNLSAFLEHNVLLDAWTVSFGLLANRNTGLDNKWRLYPGIDVAYRLNENVKFIASWNMALRMPTFTDLYYSGANIEGNKNLKPEKTSDFNVGTRASFRGFIGDLQLFYSHKTDMIDWVTYNNVQQVDPVTSAVSHTSDGIFHSVNFKRDNLGATVNLQFLPREVLNKDFPIRSFAVKYCYIHESSDYGFDVIASKYAMDYMRNKLVISSDGTIYSRLNLNLSWRFCDRDGINNPDYSVLDGKLSWDDRQYSIYLSATNLLNKRYTDYSYVRQPGFCFTAGLKLKF